MRKRKFGISPNTINQEVLTKKEKIIVWVTCIFSPVFSGAVYYYGWGKIFPQKAKQANKISWLALLSVIFILFLVGALSELI